MIYTIDGLLCLLAHNILAEIDGNFVPARPTGNYFFDRIKAAWFVLCGKADAVIWPGGQ